MGAPPAPPTKPAPPTPAPTPHAQALADQAIDWAARTGNKPPITDEPYASATAEEKQWLLDSGYCV